MMIGLILKMVGCFRIMSGVVNMLTLCLVINNIKLRVEAVKAKMAFHSKRSSGIHSVPSSPVPAYSPIQVNTPPK